MGERSLDVAAPSVDYVQLHHTRDTGMRPAPGGAPGPDLRDGTSFAAPLVAGIAALVLDAEPSLTGDPCGLADRILRNAVQLEGLDGLVGGRRRVDALRAVNDTVTASVRACP